MLVRLLAEQIACRWDVIKHALNDALPPTADRTLEGFNNILERLLNGEMHCWLSLEHEGSEAKAVVVTGVVEDFSGPRSLLIYCFARLGDSGIESDEFSNIFNTLRKFAVSKSCVSICYYTALEGFIKMAKWLGGNTDYSYANIPINQGDNDESLHKSSN